MKVNLKTTNEAENAAATLVCHQKGPRTVNGIIGNTRRGIVIDKTLDPDSNNPVANKPVSNALAALAGKIDAALQKPTGLTKTKLVGVGTNGQENIEIGDNLILANGKLSATGGGGGGSSDVNFVEANTDFSAFTGDLNPDKVNVLKLPENSGYVVLSNDGSNIYYASILFTQTENDNNYLVAYIITADSTTKAVTMEPQTIWINTPETRSQLIVEALAIANAFTFFKHSLTVSSKDSYFVSFAFDCPKEIQFGKVSDIAYSSRTDVRLPANGYVYRDNKEFPVVYVVLKTNHSIGINYLSDKNTVAELTITEATVTDVVYCYYSLDN